MAVSGNNDNRLAQFFKCCRSDLNKDGISEMEWLEDTVQDFH